MGWWSGRPNTTVPATWYNLNGSTLLPGEDEFWHLSLPWTFKVDKNDKVVECAPGELFIGIDKRIRVSLDSREVVLDGEDAPTPKEAVVILPDQGMALGCALPSRKDGEQPPSEPQGRGGL